jgi:hypothetical protein
MRPHAGSGLYAYAENEPGCRAPISNEPSDTFKANALKYARPAEAAVSVSIPGPVPFSDLLTRTVPPVQELIPGLIERGIVTFLSAPGGSHKSRLAVQWGLCLANGAPVFGRPVETATFVYLSYEDHPDEVSRRAKKITRCLGLPSTGRAMFWDLTTDNKPLAIVTEDGVQPQPFLDQLSAYLRSIPGHKFIVIDSAYNALQFTGQAKINEGSVKAGIELLGRFCRETDSTMLVLWHPSQAGQGRGDASGWSVAWHNTPRARVSLKPVTTGEGRTLMEVEGVYTLKVEKRNNAAKGEPITLRYDDGAMVEIPLVSPGAKLAGRSPEFLKAECVKLAIAMAEGGHPIQRQRRINRAHCMFTRFEATVGYMMPERAIKAILADACHPGGVYYHDYTKGTDKAAGYYAHPEPAPASKGEVPDGF